MRSSSGPGLLPFPYTTLFRSCDGQEFENESAWLSHAATVHKYDLHVKLHRSATLPLSIRPSIRPSTKPAGIAFVDISEEHTSELQSRFDLVCRLVLVENNVDQ